MNRQVEGHYIRFVRLVAVLNTALETEGLERAMKEAVARRLLRQAIDSFDTISQGSYSHDPDRVARCRAALRGAVKQFENVLETIYDDNGRTR